MKFFLMTILFSMAGLTLNGCSLDQLVKDKSETSDSKKTSKETYPSVEGNSYSYQIYGSLEECKKKWEETGRYFNCTQDVSFSNGKAIVMDTDIKNLLDYKQNGNEIVVFGGSSLEVPINRKYTISDDGKVLTDESGKEYKLETDKEPTTEEEIYPSVEGSSFLYRAVGCIEEQEFEGLIRCSEKIAFYNGMAHVQQLDTFILLDYEQKGKEILVFGNAGFEDPIDMKFTVSDDGKVLTDESGKEYKLVSKTEPTEEEIYPSVEGNSYSYQIYGSLEGCKKKWEETGRYFNCTQDVSFSNGKAIVMDTDIKNLLDYKQNGNEIVVFGGSSLEVPINRKYTISDDGKVLTDESGKEYKLETDKEPTTEEEIYPSVEGSSFLYRAVGCIEEQEFEGLIRCSEKIAFYNGMAHVQQLDTFILLDYEQKGKEILVFGNAGFEDPIDMKFTVSDDGKVLTDESGTEYKLESKKEPTGGETPRSVEGKSYTHQIFGSLENCKKKWEETGRYFNCTQGVIFDGSNAIVMDTRINALEYQQNGNEVVVFDDGSLEVPGDRKYTISDDGKVLTDESGKEYKLNQIM